MLFVFCLSPGKRLQQRHRLLHRLLPELVRPRRVPLLYRGGGRTESLCQCRTVVLSVARPALRSANGLLGGGRGGHRRVVVRSVVERRKCDGLPVAVTSPASAVCRGVLGSASEIAGSSAIVLVVLVVLVVAALSRSHLEHCALQVFHRGFAVHPDASEGAIVLVAVVRLPAQPQEADQGGGRRRHLKHLLPVLVLGLELAELQPLHRGVAGGAEKAKPAQGGSKALVVGEHQLRHAHLVAQLDVNELASGARRHEVAVLVLLQQGALVLGLAVCLEHDRPRPRVGEVHSEASRQAAAHHLSCVRHDVCHDAGHGVARQLGARRLRVTVDKASQSVGQSPRLVVDVAVAGRGDDGVVTAVVVGVVVAAAAIVPASVAPNSAVFSRGGGGHWPRPRLAPRAACGRIPARATAGSTIGQFPGRRLPPGQPALASLRVSRAPGCCRAGGRGLAIRLSAGAAAAVPGAGIGRQLGCRFRWCRWPGLGAAKHRRQRHRRSLLGARPRSRRVQRCRSRRLCRCRCRRCCGPSCRLRRRLGQPRGGICGPRPVDGRPAVQ
mmetsp:Transcript_4104/g.17207  ORF Transcript_4104/g.17207 Transcript_4104/m.17207 type:complete len:553 (+) Transcript_4104:2469-4127(+)